MKYLYINQEKKGFFQFQIVMNVLASSFHFTWIPMLWVYTFILSVQILMSENDPRAERVNIIFIQLERLNRIGL